MRREFFSDAQGKVQARVISTNTVEGFYSIFKRGMKGVYQHRKEKAPAPLSAEFDFRYSYRARLGYDDEDRMSKAFSGIVESAYIVGNRREGGHIERMSQALGSSVAMGCV